MRKNKELINAQSSLNKTKSGSHAIKENNLIKFFGCLKCTWAGSKDCPHEIVAGGHHTNWICGERLRYLKERLRLCGSMPRLIQQEELFKLSQISEKMLWEYHEQGDLPDDFKHISKLIVGLTDKMRRQDEGIKVQGEFTVAHEDFKNLVEAEAKKIEERNNRTKQGDFKAEV